MNVIEADAYLGGIREIQRKIDSIQQCMDEVEIPGLKAQAYDAEKVQASSGDPMLNYVVRREKYYRKLAGAMAELVAAKEDAVARILRLDNGRYAELLTRKYVLFQRWEQICFEMHISLRHIYRVRSSALLDFCRANSDLKT